MKNLLLSGLLAALSLLPAFGQLNTLTATTTGAAVSATATTVTVAATTGIVVPNASTGVTGSTLFVQSPGTKGEAMRVLSFSGLVVKVIRGTSGTPKVAHTSGALVFIGSPDLFYTYDPSGGCTAATVRVTPYVNILTGYQFTCSTVALAWVPSWGGNPGVAVSSATVASAASAVVPTGKLFTISGTAAITGFTFPLGFNGGGSFSVIPSGAFTWTTAGNIGVAGTAVVGRVIIFTWDASASKWYPSYV